MRVVDAGSFRAAARQWGRSPAVVSKYVSALEAHLGVALLRRTTRTVRLSEAGRAFHAECKALVQAVEGLEADVRAQDVALQGRLRVSAPPGFVHTHRSLVLGDFLRRYPKVQIDLQMTHEMVDLVQQGIDVAIRITAPRDSALVVRRLGPAPMVLVASAGYLESNGVPGTVAELAEHPCLVDTNFRDGARWRFEVDGEVVAVEVQGPVMVDSPLVVADLAEDGLGLALVPEMVARARLEAGALVRVDVGAPAFGWSIYAVYPRRRFVSARVRAFVEHVAAGLGRGLT